MIRLLAYNEFDEMFALMERSFPLDELRTYDDEKALLERPEYNAYVLTEDNSEIIGFITVWKFDGFSYIDHFAVNPVLRNSGIGGKILAEILKQSEKRVCLEVESPDNELACRRIGFYTRNGFYLNNYSYIQPPISDGRKPIPLLIMTNGCAIDREEFERIRATLYERVYNVSSEAYR